MTFLTALQIILAIGLIIGTIFAARSGYSKEAGQAQARLITALKEEVAVLQREVRSLKRAAARQENVLSTIRYALKPRGIHITVQDDFVTLSMTDGTSKVTQIRDRLPVIPDDDADDAG
jgi:hypothetical protein